MKISLKIKNKMEHQYLNYHQNKLRNLKQISLELVKEIEKEENKLLLEHKKYDIIKRDSYYDGVKELERRGMKRPMSFTETIRAIVEAYDSGDTSLFETPLDTCTGAVIFFRMLPEHSSYKIVQVEKNLKNMEKDKTTGFRKLLGGGGEVIIKNKYFSSLNEKEIDYKINFKYQRPNSRYDFNKKETMPDNVLWRTAVQDDYLLRAYRDIVFSPENKSNYLPQLLSPSFAYNTKKKATFLIGAGGTQNYVRSLRICEGEAYTVTNFEYGYENFNFVVRRKR